MVSTIINSCLCIPSHTTVLICYCHQDPKEVQHRDQVKRTICSNSGITLVVIPYWWNRSIESVAQTLRRIRPDISISPDLLTGDEIPVDMPKQRSISPGTVVLNVNKMQ